MLIAFGLLVIASICGTLWESQARRRDAREVPRLGRAYSVGGYSLNLDCTGPESPGAPTVILDAGLGGPAVSWGMVQPLIAEFARVCSYDRAGMGWSDPGPAPRSSQQVATELHAVLKQAGVPPPHILVAHSMAGFHARVFHQMYPGEVAGMVLVDSAQEDQNAALPPSLKKWLGSQNEPPGWFQRTLATFLSRAGLARLAAQSDPTLLTLTPDLRRQMVRAVIQPKSRDAALAELLAFDQSAEQARRSGTLGGMPLVVLTAGRESRPELLPEGVNPKDLDDFRKAWITDLQMRLVHLSSQGRQVIVEDSADLIPFEKPAVIAAAVREVYQGHP